MILHNIVKIRGIMRGKAYTAMTSGATKIPSMRSSMNSIPSRKENRMWHRGIVILL